jgi:hypothetical protein
MDDLRTQFDKVCFDLDQAYGELERAEFEVRRCSNKVMLLEIDKKLINKDIMVQLNTINSTH